MSRKVAAIWADVDTCKVRLRGGRISAEQANEVRNKISDLMRELVEADRAAHGGRRPTDDFGR